MFLSIPALREIVIDTISKKTNIPQDRVKQILESDGPWTDHDRFLTNTFMTARQHSGDAGVDLSTAMGGIADLTELGMNQPIGNPEAPEKLTAVSEETGQPLKTIKAVNTAYFEFIDTLTTLMKKRFNRGDVS